MSDTIGNPQPSAGIVKRKDDAADARSVNMTDKDDAQRFDEIDKEVAKYVADGNVTISPERSRELRRKIDRRVLVVMITTYFLQAIDKGTMSFASIMGLTEDAGLLNEDGSISQKVGGPYVLTRVSLQIVFTDRLSSFRLEEL